MLFSFGIGFARAKLCTPRSSTGTQLSDRWCPNPIGACTPTCMNSAKRVSLGYRLSESSRTSPGSATRRSTLPTLSHATMKYLFRSCSRPGAFGMLRESGPLWCRRGARWEAWARFCWAAWLFSGRRTVEWWEIYFDGIFILYLDRLPWVSAQLFRPELHPSCRPCLPRGSLSRSRTRTCFLADVIFLCIGFLGVPFIASGF